MSKKQVKSIFEKRYILGEGYPWGLGPLNETYGICLCQAPTAINKIWLNWPIELSSPDLPKYRLVLERIDEST